LIAWFGPRGLSSLLLILVPVFAAAPGSEQLFFICCFVVLLSVALHGSSLMFLKRDAFPIEEKIASRAANGIPLESQASPISLENHDTDSAPVRISVAEMRRLQQSGTPILVLDVRSERNFESRNLQAQGPLRVPPDHAVQRLIELRVPRRTWLVAFCA
jgi:NhaP-type Na+/H+ and K+/H+ antiporter